jgi:Sulfotransferase family
VTRALLRNALALLEPLAVRAAPKLDIPPIFVVGLPRVGSTLLSIVLTRHLRCAYFSNMMMATPASPVAMAMMARTAGRLGGVDDLYNRYGETRAGAAPNQGYRFWTRFITQQTGPAQVREGMKERLLASVWALQGAAGGPLVNKWQTNALRVPLLSELFPGALFVNLRRDELAVAVSLLQARRSQRLGEAHWFSVRPPALVDVSALGVHEQIAEQIAGVRDALENGLAGLGGEQVLPIDYGQFCADPNAAIETIADRYEAATGFRLTRRGRFAGTLEARHGPSLPAADRTRLAEAIRAASERRSPATSPAPVVAA